MADERLDKAVDLHGTVPQIAGTEQSSVNTGNHETHRSETFFRSNGKRILDVALGNDDNRDMAKKRDTLTDQLRHVIQTCGVSRYRVWKETGVAESTLSKFMTGERGLSMEALDAIWRYLDLEVVQRKRKRS